MLVFRRCLVACLFVVAPVLCASSLACADDCSGTSVQFVEAPGAVRAFDVAYDRATKRWKLTWRNGDKGFALPKALDGHAHLAFYVPRGSQNIAVLDSSADHQLEHRLFVLSDKGKIVADYSVTDLFGPEAKRKVTRSISHLQWLDYKKTVMKDGRTLRVVSAWGKSREIRL